MDTSLSSHRASALLVAIGQYDDTSHDELKQIPTEAKKLADVLIDGGYQHEYPELLQGGVKGTISPIVQKWLQDASRKDTLLLYWAGHGKSDIDGHYLIVRNSPGKNLDGENAFFTSTLGKMVANSLAEKVLVLLDTCFSGAGAVDIAGTISKVLAARPPIPGVERAFAIIASAHPLKKAQEAVFCRSLTALLAKGDKTRRWTDNDEFILPSDLAKVLQDRIGEPIGYKADGPDQEFVPNPRYRGALPAEDVETRQRRLTMAGAEEHFLTVSRGIEIGSSEWYFTGRERILTELVQWLKTAQNGMVVVTGPAGSGKSAVMGRVAILSDPHYRKIAESEQALSGVPLKNLPPEGIIDVAVHAKGKTLADCIGAIAAALDITLSEGERTDPVALIEAMRGLNERITIIVDALDEAKQGHHFSIGGMLLKPMSQLPKVRLLVGTRRSPDGKVIPEKEPRHGRLQELFGEDTRIINLEDEPNTEEDIAGYVRRRLMDSRHRDDPARVDRVSRAVAVQAAGIFLYARVVVRTLEEVENLDEKLPDDALDAFVKDITRRFGDRKEMLDELLCALAWAEGKGLSRRVWAPVANALSRTGAYYTDDEVSWVLKHAGWHIIEAGEEGQAVYRLPHRLLADYYRNRFEELDANSRITRALSEGITGEGWRKADPYLWRHLASYAAIAGLLDRLITDPGYLAVAEPRNLLPALSSLTGVPERKIAGIYRRIAISLPNTSPLERMALIHLTACQEEPDLAHVLEPPVPTTWRCRWAHWKRSTLHTVLMKDEWVVNSVAIGVVEGVPILAVASGDGSVYLFDLQTGERLDQHPWHDDSVSSVTFIEVDGAPIIVSGGWDGTVRIWDVVNRKPTHNLQADISAAGIDVGIPRMGGLPGMPAVISGGVTAIAGGAIDGVPLVVSLNKDGKVQLWDVRIEQDFGDPLNTKSMSKVRSIAFGGVDRTPIVISGHDDGSVRLWDARTRQQLDEALNMEPVSGVSSIAFGELDAMPVVVSGHRDGSVRLWDARTRQQLGVPCRTGSKTSVSSITIGELEETSVVVAGHYDGSVRVVNAYTRRPWTAPFMGHDRSVEGVAMGMLHGFPVVVSGAADGTVRMWDVWDTRDQDEPFERYAHGVETVDIGKLDDATLIVSGHDDGSLGLWDAYTGRPRCDPFKAHDRCVSAVALGQVDGVPKVVSAGEDAVMRLWDVGAKSPKGQVLDGQNGRKNVVRAIAFGNVDGAPMIVSGGVDRIVRLWDGRSGRLRGDPLRGHQYEVTGVDFGQVDGTPVVVSASREGALLLWNANTGLVCDVKLPDHKIEGIALDGPFIWEPPIGAVVRVAFGQVGKTPIVISGSWDKAIMLTDARNGKPLLGKPLVGHGGALTGVALTQADGVPVAVSGSEDETLRLWSVRTGEQLFKIPLRSKVTGLAVTAKSEVAIGTPHGLVVLEI